MDPMSMMMIGQVAAPIVGPMIQNSPGMQLTNGIFGALGGVINDLFKSAEQKDKEEALQDGICQGACFL